jgi:putative transposase
MPRLARLIVPGIPHHLTQRGNRRQRVFFSEEDKSYYLKILKDNMEGTGLRILGYCLMDNHVHIVSTPSAKVDFASVLGETHRKYTTIINTREKWKGHLWQERYWSFPLDAPYLYRAVRYVERNPVRAGITRSAGGYRWSSARGHLLMGEDPILDLEGSLPIAENWAAYLDEDEDDGFPDEIHLHQKTGRPLGDDDFLTKLEAMTGLRLHKKKPGRPRKVAADPTCENDLFRNREK